MSKKKDISDEDKALFKEAAKGAKPIANDKVQFKKAPVKATRRTQDENEEPSFHLSDPFETTIDAEQRLYYADSSLRPRFLRQFRQGALPIDANLDLHGETIDQARQTFLEFLTWAQENNYRCIRIIHGKGTRSEGQKPKLKSHVYHWLTQIPAVLAFSSCQPKHGGMGAVYVLLSNKRQKLP